ncbi:MAG TPA: Npt1/Npt2 family nucleotide transporter [Vicinamibacteria bacterium]|nr:Npt1/Npt2 family nucleotide transporter [Vicinamibacteria bacterium]
MTTSNEGPAPPTILDRFLSLFTDVHPGESGTALLMFLNLFLLLLGYYILRTVREPLILASGAEVKSYASAGQALTLMGFVPLYGWFSAQVDRMKLISGFILFFIVCIEVFSFGGLAGLPYVGIAYYIWVGIFSLATIAQFWSYANDIYRREAGERLFPFIVLGASLGAPVGAKIAEDLFEAGMSPYRMMQITAAILCVHLALYAIINRRVLGRPGQAEATKSSLSSAAGGFKLVFGSQYLRLLAVLIILLNVVNTAGNYIVDKSVVNAADAAVAADPSLNRDAFIGSFYGSYAFYFSTLGLLLQAFVVSRLVKHLGMSGALLALPLVALGAYALIAAGAGLAFIRWAKIAENATDYSVMNTARQLVWLPTSRDEKYKAKQAIDTFFVRTGDLLQAVLVFAGTTFLGLGARGFALVNLVLITAWLAVALLLLKEYGRILRKRVDAAAGVAEGG